MISVSWSLIAFGVFTAFVLGWITGRSTAAARSLSRPSSARTLASLGPAIRTEIEAAIASGHKIEAIKLLREATGMGLKESKETIEAMERI